MESAEVQSEEDLKQENAPNTEEILEQGEEEEENKPMLTSISLPVFPQNPSQVQIKQVWDELGLNEDDLQKLKNGKFDEVSEEGKQRLQELNITEDMIADALLNSLYQEIDDKFDSYENVDRVEDKYEAHTQEETADIRKKSFSEFLCEKGLSKTFTETLLRTGITDEVIRFLKTMSFRTEEIETLQELWRMEQEREKDDSFSDKKSLSTDNLSGDGFYLKKNLSEPLVRALREIVAKKPHDPVEFLGNWLLHYRLCEERRKRQEELKLQVAIEREKLRKPEVEEYISTTMPSERGEEEQVENDWDFINYDPQGH